MIVSIADTHTAIWYLFNDPRLSSTARQAFQETAANGGHVGVSSISLAEMVYLCEKGRIVATAVEDLLAAFNDPENVLQEVALDSHIVQGMRLVPRDQVPDLPDRIVAATGLRYGVPVISRDGKIRAASLQTIW